MNNWQKIINVCLVIIITLLLFRFEKLNDEVRLLEELTEDQIKRAGEIAKITHMNEMTLRGNEDPHLKKVTKSSLELFRCTLENAFNSSDVLKENIPVSLNKNKDVLIVNSIEASGNDMNDYVNGNQYMFWGEDQNLSYMINISKKEFHIHSNDGSMIVYKCNF